MSIENVFTTALFIPISILGFFWYKYYHYILIEEKLKTLRLKDFNEKHRKNLFWASIIAFLLGAIFLEEPKWFSLEKDNLKFTKLVFPYILYLLLYCSLLFLIWYGWGFFNSKCKKCKYIWAYTKKTLEVKKHLTDIDRDAYDGPGQVKSLGRKYETISESKVENICRFCKFKEITYKDNKWMKDLGDTISKINKK